MFSKVNLLILLSSLVLIFSCQTPSVVATLSIQKGDQANNLNDYKNAEAYYCQYLEVAPSLGTMRNPVMEAEVNRKLAHVKSTKGLYEEAENHMLEALRIDNSLSDNLLNLIEDYRQLGITRVYQGDYSGARVMLDTALILNDGMESSLKAQKRLSIADTYLSSAQLNLSLGNLNNSWEHVNQAIQLYESEKEKGEGIMEAYLLKSKIYLLQDQRDSCLTFLNESIEIAKELDYGTYRQKQVQGDISTNQGQPEEAINIYMEALEEAKGSNILPQIIWAHIKLADAFQLIGNTRQSNFHLREADRLRNQIDQTSSLSPSLDLRMGDIRNAYDFYNLKGASLGLNIARLKLAETMISYGKVDSVEYYVSQAFDFFTYEKIKAGQVKALILWSRYLTQNYQWHNALEKLTLAEKLDPDPENLWKIQFGKSLVAKGLKNDSDYETYVNQSIETIESIRSDISSSVFRWYFLDDKLVVYDDYISYLMSKGRVIEAFDINESARSRTFLEILSQKVWATDESSLEFREQRLRRDISNLKLQIQQNEFNAVNSEDLNTKLNALFEEYDVVLNQLASQNEDYLRLVSVYPVGYDDLKKVISKGQKLIEFWISERQMYVWVIDENGINSKVLQVSKDSIMKAVSMVRNSIQFGLANQLQEGFKNIFKLLAPVFEDISPQSNVVLIPNGPLHFLPFGALFDGEKYLLESIKLAYAPSASVFALMTRNKNKKVSDSFLGMALGNEKIGEFIPLPGTSIEVEQLSQLYNNGKFTYDLQTSEEAFKEVAINHGIIHLATHGVLNSYKPSESYILMNPTNREDGKLSVHEIYDLNLKAELVTLSACETGLGDLSKGDELIGLSRAFLYAGSSSIIVSLWQVDDISTSILMTRLHQLLDGGYSISEALNLAQQDLLKSNFDYGTSRGLRSVRWHEDIQNKIKQGSEDYISPYFWAPFILIGSAE